MYYYHLLFGFLIALSSCTSTTEYYVCPPCDQTCDTLTFAEPGTCPHCQMALVPVRSLMPPEHIRVEDIQIETGSGSFWIPGGPAHPNDPVQIYYHRPAGFSDTSRILMVISGAGRDADEYRDAWIKAADRHDVLILAPQYSEQAYPFEDYHMVGWMQDVNLEEAVTFVPGSNIARLDESALSYTVNQDRNTWLFADFDRLFALVIAITGSRQSRYDLFGHSAGGQILHRLAISYLSDKVDRIVAANSGFYTMPDTSLALPFGLKGLPIPDEMIKDAYQRKLALLLGESDNARETGGTLLRSPTADQQGLHRLARGRYYYQQALQSAGRSGVSLQWEKVEIPEVGHEFRAMSQAAAKYLYQ